MSQIETSELSPTWFAIQVRETAERYIANLLIRKGYECFLPTVPNHSSRFLDEYGDQGRPLFPGYVFCRFRADKSLPILMLPGVMTIVSAGNTLAPVDDGEIFSLQEAIRRQLAVRISPYVPSEAHIKVCSGPMAELSGSVDSAQNSQRLLITIAVLHQSVVADAVGHSGR